MAEGRRKSDAKVMKGSVMFQRQGDPDDPKRPKPPSSAAGSSSCCAPLEKMFNSVMSFPDPAERNRKKELKDLPRGQTQPFDDTPAEQKGGLEVAVSSKAKESDGWINQDAVISCAFRRREDEDLARFLFAVCDGHGRNGHKVSDLVTSRLPCYLALREDLVTNTKKAFEDSVKEVDNDVYIDLGPDVEYSGSTAVCVLVDKIAGMLHISNIGDSRAVLAREQYGSLKAVPLTVDHKPDLPEEKHRIEMYSGYVSPYFSEGLPSGPARVWDSRSMVKPGLACSRSIGDGAARNIGVIAKPDVTSRSITAEDKFILIASDGLWDSVSEQDAVEMAQMFIHTPSAALAALTEAVRRAEEDTLVDDTTIILIKL